MCGRYTVTVPIGQIEERFDAVLPPETGFEPHYNAAPSQNLPTLLNKAEMIDDKRQLDFLRWGLIPHWSKDASTGYKMINARAETLTEKPAYRSALQKYRCLVLADSFYEWQATDDGKKVPMRIMLKSGEPFAFAGLWSNWKNSETGEWLRTFTIITGKANEVVQPIHNRMPMILLPENEKIWLDDGADEAIWMNMLQPYPAELMTAYPVSKRVNAPGNDDPTLIEPVNVAGGDEPSVMQPH